MNPWLAALIPLGIIVVLGLVAFFIGYRQYLPDRTDQDSRGHGPKSSSKPMSTSAMTDASLKHDQLREKISTSDRLLSRAVDERAVLVQFIDAGAPEAASVQKFVAELRQEFGDRISFAARHLPATEPSRIVSAALEAADRQGKFDDFLDALLAPTGRPAAAEVGGGPGTSVEKLQRIACELEVDLQQFTADMESPSTAAVLAEDRKDAAAMGITRAPSFLLLDGRHHNIITSRENFHVAVAAAAAASR
ncbi:DsbA family protein [Arthrobacter sp. TMS2-4]